MPAEMLDALDTAISYGKPVYGTASRGDESFSIGRISDHLKTSFASAVEDYSCVPANENRPRVLEIAESLGIEIVTPRVAVGSEKVHSDLRGATRAFQAAQGIETIFYKGGIGSTLGFSPSGNPNLIFINMVPEAKRIPISCMLSHELVHSY